LTVRTTIQADTKVGASDPLYSRFIYDESGIDNANG
jgi:hypothetical protein